MKAPLLALLLMLAPWLVAATDYTAVVPGHALSFPRDGGSHPGFRTEWWYVTGWLEQNERRPLGFQITFFRTRPKVDTGNPSRFTPHHILFAHAAISDPRRGRLLTAQRSARAGFGLAEAKQEKTEVWIDDWSLKRLEQGYAAQISAQDFQLKLEMRPTQAPLLHGHNGFSRKGPHSASYYYSEPQLEVTGTVRSGDTTGEVRGTAWLDHEWSSTLLDERAAGWDWVGISLHDGGALMAFRMRGKDGKDLWAGGTLRRAGGTTTILARETIGFFPRRVWKSARTGIEYPVVMEVHAGSVKLVLRPLMDDQEHDTLASTGTIYWEGAVSALERSKTVGHGYLELTGYGQALRL
ncbi:MAG: lipocalin-like domain-containing protein [Burkholderiales bacterium]